MKYILGVKITLWIHRILSFARGRVCMCEWMYFVSFIHIPPQINTTFVLIINIVGIFFISLVVCLSCCACVFVLFCFDSIRFVGMYGAFNSHRLFAFNFYSLDPLLFSTHAILFSDAIANCYYVLQHRIHSHRWSCQRNNRSFTVQYNTIGERR